MGARFRDAFARDAHSQPALTSAAARMNSIEADHPPPSSASLIPSSAPRKRSRDAAFGSRAAAGAAGVGESSPAVPATVSKPPAAPREPGRARSRSQKQSHVAATPARPAASRRADFFAGTTTPRIAEAEEEDDFDDDDDGAVLPSSPVALRRIAQPRFTSGAAPASRPPRKPATSVPVPVPVPHVDSGIGMPSSSPPSRSSGGGGGDVLAETPRKPARSVPGPEPSVIATTPVAGGKVVGAAAGRGGGGVGNRSAFPIASAVMHRQKGMDDEGSGGKNETENENESPRRRSLSIYERLGWDDDFDELG